MNKKNFTFMNMSGKSYFATTVCAVVLSLCFNSCHEDRKAPAIFPGQKWVDNNGKHINAHGGNIIKDGDTWYWYGERRNTENSYGPMPGVSVYKSSNLVDWTDCGVALATVNEPDHMLEAGCIIERPKVMRNPQTGKYVMLFHHELKGRGYEAARVGFAESDTPEGPFVFVKSLRPNAKSWPSDWNRQQIARAMALDITDYKKWWTPEWYAAVNAGLFLNRDYGGGQMSRDMTVYIDDDGKAYHIYSSEENLTLHIAELTDDYMNYTGKYVRMAPAGHNEAPTILKRDGKYWMITSGCTGWAPNEARMFWAENIFGPWHQAKTPFRGEKVSTSFDSQGTFIIQLPNADKYIFMADRWSPDSLSESRHIWLPIQFDANGSPFLEWQDSWTLAE